MKYLMGLWSAGIIDYPEGFTPQRTTQGGKPGLLLEELFDTRPRPLSHKIPDIRHSKHQVISGKCEGIKSFLHDFLLNHQKNCGE